MCGATTTDLSYHWRPSLRRHPFHECFQDDALHCWHQRCLQLRSRRSSHFSILVSIVLMMRKSATNLGHCQKLLGTTPIRKDALGMRPFSELWERSAFSEQLSEFEIPFSECEIPFSEWHPTIEQYENQNSRSNSRSDSRS